MKNEDLSNCVITSSQPHDFKPGDYVVINGTTFKVGSIGPSRTQFMPRSLTRWEYAKMILSLPFSFIAYQSRRLYYQGMNIVDRWMGIDD